MRPLLILSALAVTACQPKEEGAPALPPKVPAAPRETRVVGYACEDGKPVQARYVGQDSATLVFDGKTYSLRRAISASGARYTGDGLQWWSKGDDGLRAPLAPGEEIASAKPVTCWSGEPPPVEPPAPGTPGGLPDDRTPVSEGPFTPESAQGAANVVQTFYAHLSTGRTAEAARLMHNATPPDVTRFSSYNAQVGAPGRIEGAAGSLFVEVPVVVYGRLKSGQEVHQSGKAVLRRVNDVPGSTPEQRQWRIERIELAS
ncbi:MliC family protein [Phenylobacterium sp.]|uniref:MliC family protein n=1 Tax=Phenylobacterium sp. TaxID=1871053 RepID=UPI00391C3A2B